MCQTVKIISWEAGELWALFVFFFVRPHILKYFCNGHFLPFLSEKKTYKNHSVKFRYKSGRNLVRKVFFNYAAITQS